MYTRSHASVPDGRCGSLRRMTNLRRSVPAAALMAVATTLAMFPGAAVAQNAKDTEIVNQTPIPVEVQPAGAGHLLGVTEAGTSGGFGRSIAMISAMPNTQGVIGVRRKRSCDPSTSQGAGVVSLRMVGCDPCRSPLESQC
jgi:hypothetical protein